MSLGIDQMEKNAAIHASQRLIELDSQLDEGSLVRMMVMGAQLGSVETSELAWQLHTQTGYVPSEIACNALLHTYASAGELEKAFRTVDYIKKNNMTPSQGTLSFLAENCAVSEENADAAYYTLIRLNEEHQSDSDNHAQVHIESVNCVIRGCAHLSDFDRAFGTFAEIESKFNLKPTVDTYNALLFACVQTKQINGAETLWKEMEQAGIEPNKESHHQLISVFSRANNAERALEHYHEMQQHGVVPLVDTCKVLALKFARIGNFDVSDQLIEDMKTAGLPVSMRITDFVQRAKQRRENYNRVKQQRQNQHGHHHGHGNGHHHQQRHHQQRY
eukprot:TRINITY_DN1720_c0_g1_i4.p1 TRINITY_DN1720_c0_g1~~TRINITY_DN1720_c0_g1_i4.p1  ORF type:complete len:332 (-),score=108.08 TRINITY_DN1720_c0_g1_i4:35-1030(-)